MTSRFALTLIVWLGLLYSAHAEGTRLTADQITTLLTGNTALGQWAGRQYRQYFSKDGTTIYATRKGQSSLGRWRVDETRDLYESIWQRTDWDAYVVIRQRETLYWQERSGKRYAFTMVNGQQLIWPKD